MIRLTASEHDEQTYLFEWARLHESRYPDLRWLFAIPNGGLRHPVVANKLAAEGVRRGAPDICLPAPRGSFHGLFIEMKAARGKVSIHQQEFLQGLRERGYCTAVCRGWDAARKLIVQYLALKEPL